MLSVPAEVTVILLDIEGTTTPIAFVKVRGGRERGSDLCLKALKTFFLGIAGLVPQTRVRRRKGGVALRRSEMGGSRKAVAGCGDLFVTAPCSSSSPFPVLG